MARNSHYIDGNPRILEGVGPMVAGKAHAEFQSLLKGRVVGTFKDIRLGQDAECINIAGPVESAMGMAVTLVPGTSFEPSEVGAGKSYYRPITSAMARIKWGAGIMSYVEVDFGRGCTIPLFGSSLVVRVARDAALYGSSGQLETLGAFVSHLPAVRSVPLTCTVRLDSTNSQGVPLAPAGTLNVMAPPFAKSVQVVVAPLGSAFSVSLCNSFSVVLATFQVGAGGLMDPVTLPNDCARIIVTNTGAANIDNWRAIYGLAL